MAGGNEKMPRGPVAPAASVVIPSYNSRATIGRCLAALERQSFAGEFEVIVVDSSEDGTDEFISVEYPWVRLFHLEQKTLPGKARNLGIREARSDVVLFTDADCIAAPGWVEKHIEAQRRFEVVGGALANANPWSLVSWASHLLEFSGYTPSRRQSVTSCLVTANLSCRKSICLDVPFPEDIWPGEDRAFIHAVGQKAEMVFDGTIVVAHINRASLFEFVKHQGRLGEAAAKTWARIDHHPILRAHPQLAFLTPAWRLLTTFHRLRRDTPSFLIPAGLVWPIVLVGAFFWSSSFYKQFRDDRKS